MSPTIYKTSNLSIRIYPKDHNPPHVHVIGPEGEARFRLEDLVCYYSRGFTQKSLKRILLFLSENQKSLMEAWHEYQK